MLRERMKAALKTLVSQKGVDPKRVVVMGYCFGGTAALELARSGAQLAGVVSFHGGLSTPTPQDAKNIKGKVLTLHGEDDPYVNKDEVAAFKKELTDANVSFEFISYPGAVHSFAVPSAGSDNSKGAAYNAEADKKSWERFKEFLNEVAKR
jgi:dienelactone hydrolase